MKKKPQQIMSPAALALVAARFKVLAEPVRLQILQYLETGEFSVTDLAASIGTTQPNISKHLKVLQTEGLISRFSRGNSAFYQIADPSVFELCDVVCGSLREKFEQRSAIFS
jgi:DNA-binding transcriptional ArsR family regulator